MANSTLDLHGLCPPPFYQQTLFPEVGGHVEGRMCAELVKGLSCCLPCPLTDWAYPDTFNTLSSVANWVNVAGMASCVFLLVSWIVLPVEKTHRHYLSICLTCAVVLMNLGFIIPLAAKPDECYNEITPHGMDTSSVCAASGAFLLGGGWAGIMWIFLRALSLHLQICWQIVVGRTYMWFAQILGWGIPIVGLVVLLTLSGVSFRFGATCHINHENSLADFWIPLLVFAGFTMIIQFATFGYCIKVYLASLADNTATTENSGMPSYTASIRTMTPRQAYRRVRRVIQLQWRGIVIVLVIVADVIFFSIVFVFQDNTVQAVKNDMTLALPWIQCLIKTEGDKDFCIDSASNIVVSLATVIAVLILLAMNGLWLLVLLGRWSMVTGWVDHFMIVSGNKPNKEFVSVDARANLKGESRSYEMLSHSKGESISLSTVGPVKGYATSPLSPHDGRRTPDYFSQTPEPFGQAARYQPHQHSFSAPRPPQQVNWDPSSPYSGSPPPPSPPATRGGGYEGMNPLGMNRI